MKRYTDLLLLIVDIIYVVFSFRERTSCLCI